MKETHFMLQLLMKWSTASVYHILIFGAFAFNAFAFKRVQLSMRTYIGQTMKSACFPVRRIHTHRGNNESSHSPQRGNRTLIGICSMNIITLDFLLPPTINKARNKKWNSWSEKLSMVVRPLY
ncbi:hypothetical protein R3P38DRAFT_11328 [Favolaschia claudopus]|uniref:Secreted protein n=1 Tax=Favolaschia claudopus TaxID=2862362 RepID=A0AAW0EGJ9_9AGAR